MAAKSDFSKDYVLALATSSVGVRQIAGLGPLGVKSGLKRMPSDRSTDETSDCRSDEAESG